MNHSDRYHLLRCYYLNIVSSVQGKLSTYIKKNIMNFIKFTKIRSKCIDHWRLGGDQLLALINKINLYEKRSLLWPI